MSKLIVENVFNLPNIITTFRLLLIPLYLISLAESNINFALIVLTIFILLDNVDGISARMAKQITKVGRIYDGFTDFLVHLLSFMAFYMIGLINFFWILIFIIPYIGLIIIKLIHYLKLKDFSPGTTNIKIWGTMSYVAIIAIIIDFVYKFEILVLTAVLAYICIIIDVFKVLRKT